MELGGATVPLRPSAFVCATLGLREAGLRLPEGLARLLRPVAMAAPDLLRIAEVRLYAAGYKEAPALARKVVALHRLAAEQLSAPAHGQASGNFSLRGLARAMELADRLRLEAAGSHGEAELVSRAMTDVCAVGLAAQDAEVFAGMVSDLFQVPKLAAARDAALTRKVEATCATMGLKTSSLMLQKVLQLHETQTVCPGVMLVGPAGGGKSTVLKVLSDSMSQAQGGLALERLSASCFAPEELFGGAGGDGVGARAEGLLASTLQRFGAQQPGDEPARGWLVLDGPIEPTWADGLDVALDNTAPGVCAPGLNRVRLPGGIRLILECEGLGSAAPSTVSRCGVVYIPEADVAALQKRLVGRLSQGSGPAWLAPHSWKNATGLAELCVPRALQMLAQQPAAPDRQAAVRAADSFCEMLEAVLGPEPFREPPLAPEAICARLARKPETSSATQLQGRLAAAPGPARDDPESQRNDPAFDVDRYVSACVAFALVWAFGGAASSRSRSLLGALCKEQIPQLEVPQMPEVSEHRDMELYNVMVDWGAAPTYLAPWQSLLPEATPSRDPISLFVPTTTTACYGWLAYARAERMRHTLLIGSSGSGKSAIAERVLWLPESGRPWEGIDLHFSKRTPVSGVQALLEQRLLVTSIPMSRVWTGDRSRLPSAVKPVDGRTTSNSGWSRRTSPVSKSLSVKVRPTLILVDDVSAPAHSGGGTQPPVQLLRQLAEGRCGAHERRTWRWREFEACALLATAGPPTPGSGERWLDARFLRHFQTLRLPEWSRSRLSSVLEHLVRHALSEAPGPLSGELAGLSAALGKASAELLFTVKEHYLASPEKPQQVFTSRDAFRIVEGIAMARFDSLEDLIAVARLWTHESFRTFGDKLGGSREEGKTLNNLVDSMLISNLQAMGSRIPMHD